MDELTTHTVHPTVDDLITLNRANLEETLAVSLTENAIFIGVRTRDRIIIIPVEKKPIIKMVLKTTLRFGDVAMHIGRMISKHKLTTIDSTGFCPKPTEGYCTHESYLVPEIPRTIASAEIEEINGEIAPIKGVIHASVRIIWDGA